MVVVDAVSSVCSQYIEEKFSESEGNRCQNCLKMTEYMKVLTIELKSVQSINKILSEEISQIVKEHKSTENLHTSEKFIYRSKNTWKVKVKHQKGITGTQKYFEKETLCR
jgi:hypothetical protein